MTTGVWCRGGGVMNGLVCLLLALSGQPAPISIYVGPMARDGFVVADRGVADSIKDVQGALRGKRGLVVVLDAAAATVHLLIVSRSVIPAKGGAATTTSSRIGTVEITNTFYGADPGG